jgi:hypothetical protein
MSSFMLEFMLSSIDRRDEDAGRKARSAIMDAPVPYRQHQLHESQLKAQSLKSGITDDIRLLKELLSKHTTDTTLDDIYIATCAIVAAKG